jgi:hypothetical protein
MDKAKSYTESFFPLPPIEGWERERGYTWGHERKRRRNERERGGKERE